MRVRLTCFMLVILVATASAASAQLGALIERVTCTADSSQAYALYVPARYSPDRRWSVIFCFDPGARGRVPVERLQAAAEKYGYVVAGSLNSRNGPWASNVAAIQAMITDVETHWAIDAKRVYVAGLSGGARVATQVALTGLAQGVIACSAGFPDPANVPGKVPFAFFGTAGMEDFNYAELRRLDEELASRHAAHRVVIFPGGHEWAPPELMAAGVEWLELQAMHTGTRPRDEAFIAAQFAARQATLPSGAGLERWRALQSLTADFADLTNTTSLVREAKELGATHAVKDELKAERRLADEESWWGRQLAEATQYRMSYKQKLAGDLRALADAPADSPTRAMARRAIANQVSFTRESLRTHFDNQDYAEAAGLLEMSVALRPGQARTLFDLARAQAGYGDRKAALATLAQAAAAGFADAARLDSDPLLAKLRVDPAYPEILARVRANPPEPPGHWGPP